MTSSSKVSILIISYNEKEYLPLAIKSCRSQTYENKEIIIGDDGSNDGTAEYLNGLEGTGIRHFTMPRDAEEIIPSVRVSNVIKHGLEEAEGAYCAILSGDDYFIDNNMLSEAVGFLDAHRDYNAYVNGFRRVDDAGRIIDELIPKRTSNAVYWSGGYTHISCFVFRKPRSSDLLDRMCDDTGFQYVLASGRWKYGNKATFAYRQREASIQHEANQLELSILEALIFQDVLNRPNKKLYFATLSRFYRPIKYIAKHIAELDDPKYRKYLISCAMFKNNPIDKVKNHQIPFFRMRLCYYYYSLRRKRFFIF